MKSLSKFSLVLLAAVGCAAPTVSESEGSNSSHLLAGRVVGEDELAGVLRSVGFDEATVPKMICTAKYESSFHEEATNSNTNGTTDYGIFQINSIHVGSTAGCPATSSELMNVTTNAQCAFGVFSIQGMNAWVAYKSHQAECDAAVAPAASPTDPTAPAAGPLPGTPAATPAATACADPSSAACQAACTANPSDPACQDPWCAQNPNDPACQDPCAQNPSDPACQDPCAQNPNDPACGGGGPWGNGGFFGARAARAKQARVNAARVKARAASVKLAH